MCFNYKITIVLFIMNLFLTKLVFLTIALIIALIVVIILIFEKASTFKHVEYTLKLIKSLHISYI